MTTIKQTYTIANDTARYLVVADYHIVISDHATAEDAIAALDTLAPGLDGLANTPYAVAEVLAPGESVSGSLVTSNPFDGPEPESSGSLLEDLIGGPPLPDTRFAKLVTEFESPWTDSTELRIWANEFTWGLLTTSRKVQAIADLATPVSGESADDAKFRVGLALRYAAILAESLERGERTIDPDRHPVTRVK